jgi:murein DD-endopeptidase MepM/ murein hydrolase activator NlpD
VAKLQPAGNGLVYSTYLGGNNLEAGRGIQVDAIGNAYVTGWTNSSAFPTTSGALQTSCGGFFFCADAFVTKLSPTGNGLVYSTYLGGSGTDQSNAIAIDSSGDAYLTGFTNSTDFPTTAGAYQTTFRGGVSDAFVTKLNATGSALVYSTYLGGSLEDRSEAIAVDAHGNAYVTGTTRSSNFPTATPFQPILGGVQDAFVTKVDPGGNALVYSTYLGGSGLEEGRGIAVYADSAYVAGFTASTNFLTANPNQPALGGMFDAFVTRLNAQGSGLVYSTYLGGSGIDGGSINTDSMGIAVDSSGNAYVTGRTASTEATFPVTVGPDLTFNGGTFDAFVAKVASPASTFVWPVDSPNPVSNGYATYNAIGNQKYHTGLDLTSSVGSLTIKATASGIVRTVPNNTYFHENHCMGNVVIIDHNGGNGPFSLYAHLASISVTDGQFVSGGTQIGVMGNSGTGAAPECVAVPGVNVHLHFEVKRRNALGNLDDDTGPFWGYTPPPDLPNLYGYENPLPYLTSSVAITERPIVTPASPQVVLTGPDPSQYLLSVATVGGGQRFVSVGETNGWYEIQIPSLEGPATGWVQASPDLGSSWFRVNASGTVGVNVRASPTTSATVLSSVWHLQSYVSTGQSPAGSGCSSPWYQMDLASNAGATSGWVCGDFVTPQRGFYTLTPCRVIDTRDPDGLWGGPALSAGAVRTFMIAGRCSVPAAANAVSINATVTQPTALGHLVLFPGGSPLPPVSTINYRAGQTRANNAIVLLGTDGTLSVACGQATGTTHFILDVNGYFQ